MQLDKNIKEAKKQGAQISKSNDIFIDSDGEY